MCRFFAHLCLFLQMIEIPVPPLPTQIILESYLGVLEVCNLNPNSVIDYSDLLSRKPASVISLLSMQEL